MGKIKELFSKIKSLKNIKLILLLLLVGVALLIAGKSMTSKRTSTDTEANNSITHTEQENKLAGILSEIEGVGEVEVVIVTKDKNDSIVVIAEGADQPIVQMKIRQAVRTLLQTDNKNIKIIKKQSKLGG